MLRTYKRDTIKIKGREVDCFIFATYEHLYNMKYNPVVVELLSGGGTISQASKNKKGCIYVPFEEMMKHDKFKIKYKNGRWNYDVLKIAQKTPFFITCKVSMYRDGKKVEDITLKQTA